MKKLKVYCNGNQKLAGVYPKFWFEENGKRYLFKAPEDDFTDIGEVFATFLYKKLDIKNFVKYKFAKTLDEVEGTICEEYKPENQLTTLPCWDILGENFILKHKEQFKDGDYLDIIQNSQDFADALEEDYYHGFYGQYENSVERIMYNLEEYCERHKLSYDKEKIIDSLVNLSILDFFTANNDRHTNNILFEITKNNELKLMPILDNGAIFGLHRKKDFILGGQKLNIYPRCGISEIGTKNEALEHHKIFGDKKQILFDAYDYAKTHKYTEKLLNKITKLNLPSLFEEFEAKEDIEIPKEIKDYMQKSYQARIDIFNDYKKQKAKLDKKTLKKIEK